MADAYVKDSCIKEHKRVDERLDHHERWIGEHEKKIDILERSDASKTEKIDHLCDQMAGLTKSIWGLVCTILLVLIGFFVWYVQNK